VVSGPVFSVLVLTEDGSARASVTLELLVKKLFRYLDPKCATQRIEFDPSDNEDAREVLTANQFKNPAHHYIRQLHGYIATQLARPDHFVVHHVDADRKWSERDRKPSENIQSVERDILAHVRLRLRARFSEAEIDGLLSRYFSLVPYWELESWLYQNTDRALKLCRHAAGCRCPELLARWRADRSELDDVPHPSDQLCLGKRYNDALLEGYPTADVIAANTSLAAALSNLLKSDALLHAIERTYQYLPDPGTQPA
jgi:hypothetical protein